MGAVRLGLNDGTLSRDHHKALDDPQINSIICTHLYTSEGLCINADSALLPADGTNAEHGRNVRSLRGCDQPSQSTPSESRRQRVK